MKLSSLNQNNIDLGLKSTVMPDIKGADLTKPLQIAKTSVDKEEEEIDKINGNPLNNIKKEADAIVNASVPAPFKNTPNINKPPNLSNI